jgi:hypothetical protein
MPHPQSPTVQAQGRLYTPSLKLAKLLTPLIASIDLQHVESDSLAQRSALTNSHIITLLDSKARRNVGGKVLVTLLVPIIFLDVVEVVTTKHALAQCLKKKYLGPIPDDDGAMHFGRDNDAREDTSTDGDLAGERTLLVYKTNQ